MAKVLKDQTQVQIYLVTSGFDSEVYVAGVYDNRPAAEAHKDFLEHKEPDYKPRVEIWPMKISSEFNRSDED